MQLQILTLNGAIFEGEIASIHVPGAMGSFQVLQSHAPIISTLTEGPVTIQTRDEKTQTFFIRSGVIEVYHNVITLLAQEMKQ